MAKLKAHVEREFAALKSGNSVSVRVKSVGDWWEADPQSKLFRLAENALFKVSRASFLLTPLTSCFAPIMRRNFMGQQT